MQTKKEQCSLFLFFYMCKCTHSGYRWSKDHQWKTQEGILLCRYSILLKEDTFWIHSIDNTLKIFLRRIVSSTKCLGIGCRQAQVCSTPELLTGQWPTLNKANEDCSRPTQLLTGNSWPGGGCLSSSTESKYQRKETRYLKWWIKSFNQCEVGMHLLALCKDGSQLMLSSLNEKHRFCARSQTGNPKCLEVSTYSLQWGILCLAPLPSYMFSLELHIAHTDLAHQYKASDFHLHWTKASFCALESTHVLLLNLDYSTFLRRVSFALHKPVCIYLKLLIHYYRLFVESGSLAAGCPVCSVRCSGNDLPKA